jgi:hypothetical protein
MCSWVDELVQQFTFEREGRDPSRILPSRACGAPARVDKAA